MQVSSVHLSTCLRRLLITGNPFKPVGGINDCACEEDTVKNNANIIHNNMEHENDIRSNFLSLCSLRYLISTKKQMQSAAKLFEYLR